MASQVPKWVTLDRQHLLVKLWASDGNRCLLGHYLCLIPSHYYYTEYKRVVTAIPVKIACKDSDNNPLKDDNGNPITLTTYGTKSVVTSEIKDAMLYELTSEQLIADWKADDKQVRLANWKAERLELHRVYQRHYPPQGQFSAVSRDIFFDNQPYYYLMGYGISGLTFKPFAQVRLPSNRLSLYVDIGENLAGLSKSKRRKAIRYGKPLAADRKAEIESKCKQAVKHYLANR